MYRILVDNDIPDNCGVAIEYNIPLTSKRIDYIISGYDESNINSAIIIELKQWEEIRPVIGSDSLVETFIGGGINKVVHPSYQVWSYKSLIENYNENVQKMNIKLTPCVYMHNYQKKTNDPLLSNDYKSYVEEAPIYAKGEAKELQDFIKKHIKFGDNKKTIYLIENGKIKPSKSLQDTIASMIKGNKEFVMIDEQQVVFDELLRLSKETVNNWKKNEQKGVYIVEGGPGTGKSVIAINLLAKLTVEEKYVCHYVTKNAAPKNVFAAKLKGTKSKNEIDILFKGSGSFIDCSSNDYDVLIVDEAHRLNAKSGIFANKGENQIKEIINASKFSIFFIDEYQRVHVNDIGSKEEIKKWAKYFNANVYEGQLISQFRCNGSDGYLAFIDNLLEIRDTANVDLEGIDYDFRVVDSPYELRNLIVDRNKENNKARLLAGYCWEWPVETRSDPNYCDIVIGDFKMSWNFNNTDTWAIDSDSVNQVGCIHTSQGLEFDYVGVIIGRDLRYENGKIITDLFERASTDQSIKGLKGMYKKDPQKAQEIADEIIRNTYRTLLTRGSKGCYVYCCDENLKNYIKSFIKNNEN